MVACRERTVYQVKDNTCHRDGVFGKDLRLPFGVCEWISRELSILGLVNIMTRENYLLVILNFVTMLV